MLGRGDSLESQLASKPDGGTHTTSRTKEALGHERIPLRQNIIPSYTNLKAIRGLSHPNPFEGVLLQPAA